MKIYQINVMRTGTSSLYLLVFEHIKGIRCCKEWLMIVQGLSKLAMSAQICLNVFIFDNVMLSIEYAVSVRQWHIIYNWDCNEKSDWDVFFRDVSVGLACSTTTDWVHLWLGWHNGLTWNWRPTRARWRHKPLWRHSVLLIAAPNIATTGNCLTMATP